MLDVNGFSIILDAVLILNNFYLSPAETKL